jgi:hypothetical protein
MMSYPAYIPLVPHLPRYLYYTALVVFFTPIALYFGPNLINFHKFTGLSPADFVPEVQSRGVPVVQAIKRYQRDRGEFPEYLQLLVPDYLPDSPDLYPDNNDSISYVAPQSGFPPRLQFFSTTAFPHIVRCEFDNINERWEVYGPFARGLIPLPPVTVTSTRPASRPTL